MTSLAPARSRSATRANSLVCWLRDSRAKSGDAGEDLVGRLDPHERLGGLVPSGDPILDVALQGSFGGMSTATDALVRQLGEPALHEVDPGSAGGCEVE